MADHFDLLVLGAGPGGYVAAIRAAQLGLKVACVDPHQALGGTCLRVGCIPSKCLLESSEMYVAARRDLAAHGVVVDEPELDLTALLKRRDKVVGMLTKGIEGLFKKNGVTRYRGYGRLTAPGQVAVRGDEAAELSAPHIILATGSVTKPLPGVELDGNLIGTSTEALNYDVVPRRLVVIGAGYIGLELGSVWARLGAGVTVLEYLDRILPGLDGETATLAHKALVKQGLEFRLGVKVTRAAVAGDGCVVDYEGGEPLVCDRVLLAAGRAPNTAELGLETVGLTLDERGFIPVDGTYRTAVEGLYAIGDVIPGPMLAHVAEEEGLACVEAIAGGAGHVNYEAIPGVCYIDPEVATVGRSEEDLQAAGVAYRKGVFPFRGNGRAWSLGSTEGQVKILADAETDRILGVHIIGPRAGELIAEAVAAIEFGASSEDLAHCCHAHPTLSEAVKEAALGVAGRTLHL